MGNRTLEIKQTLAFRLSLGCIVRWLRRKRGLNLDQLSADTGIDASRIAAIERGEVNLCIMTVGRLAEALGVTTSELMGLSSEWSKTTEQLLAQIAVPYRELTKKDLASVRKIMMGQLELAQRAEV